MTGNPARRKVSLLLSAFASGCIVSAGRHARAPASWLVLTLLLVSHRLPPAAAAPEPSAILPEPRAAEAWLGDLLLALERGERDYFAAVLAPDCPVPKSAAAWARLVTATLASDIAGRHWWIRALPEPAPPVSERPREDPCTEGACRFLLRISGTDGMPSLRIFTLRRDPVTRAGHAIGDILFVETGQDARRLFLASAPDAAPARGAAPRAFPGPKPFLLGVLAATAALAARVGARRRRGSRARAGRAGCATPPRPPRRSGQGITPRRVSLAAALLLLLLALYWALRDRLPGQAPAGESPRAFQAIAAAIAALDEDRPEDALTALAGLDPRRLPEVAVFRALARARQNDAGRARRELDRLPEGATKRYQLAQLDWAADPLGAADTLAALAGRLGNDAALARTAASLLLGHGHHAAALRVLRRAPPQPGDPVSATWHVAAAAALAGLPDLSAARIAEIRQQLELAMADAAWIGLTGRPPIISPTPGEAWARTGLDPSSLLPLIEAATTGAREPVALEPLAAQLAARVGSDHPLVLEILGRAALQRGESPLGHGEESLSQLPPLTALHILLRHLDRCEAPRLRTELLADALGAHPTSWLLVRQLLELDPGMRSGCWPLARKHAPLPLRRVLDLVLAGSEQEAAAPLRCDLPDLAPPGLTLYELASASVPWLPTVALERGLPDLLERRLILAAAEVIERARPGANAPALSSATVPAATPATGPDALARELGQLIAGPNPLPLDPGDAGPSEVEAFARAAVEQGAAVRSLGGLAPAEGLGCITYLDLAAATPRVTRRWIVAAGSEAGAFQLREWNMPLARHRPGGWVRATIWLPDGDARAVEDAMQVRIHASRYGPPAVALRLPPFAPLSILDITWEELLDPDPALEEAAAGLWPLPHLWPCRRHLLAIRAPRAGSGEFALVGLAGTLPRVAPGTEPGLWLAEQAGAEFIPCLWRFGLSTGSRPERLGRRHADFVGSARIATLDPADAGAGHAPDSIIAGVARRSRLWAAHPWEPVLARPRPIGESLASLAVSAEERLRVVAALLQAAGTEVAWWVRCRDLPELRIAPTAGGQPQFGTTPLPDLQGTLPFLLQTEPEKWIDAALQSLDDLPRVGSGARWEPIGAAARGRRPTPAQPPAQD